MGTWMWWQGEIFPLERKLPLPTLTVRAAAWRLVSDVNESCAVVTYLSVSVRDVVMILQLENDGTDDTEQERKRKDYRMQPWSCVVFVPMGTLSQAICV